MAKKYWSQKNRKVAAENPYFKVYKDEVIRPDGKDGEYNIIEFKNPGVSVIPVDNEGNIYLTNEYLYPFQDFLIQTAAGGRELTESIEKAAKRELKEEAGIEAKKFTNLGSFYTLTTFGQIMTTLFMAEDLTFSKPDTESSEVITLYKVKLTEAIRLVESHKIVDMTPAFHILRVRDYLASRESK